MRRNGQERDSIFGSPAGRTESDIYRVRIGHISPDMVLKMAALTCDYHPHRVLEKTASQGNLPGLLLHPAWIAGLVDWGIERLNCSGRIATVRISYLRPAYQADSLLLELAYPRDRGSQDLDALQFRVTNGHRAIIAEGTARLIGHHSGQSL